MINELKNVPELRFSNFCDEWVNYKLGEIVDIRGRIGFRGYTKSDIINKEDGGVLTFSPTNIIYNKLKNTVHDTYITKEKYEESPEIMVKTGDILFVKTGSTLGKSTLVANLNEEATVNPQIVVMRAKVFFHQKFTSTYLTLNKILRQVAQTRIGGAIPTLTESEIKKFQVSFPVYEEQQKIGSFFSKLDQQIELEEQKLEKLEEQKKGYMQKIFTQELKFKNSQLENIKWSYKTLEELNSFFTDGNYGESYPKSEDMSDKNDGVAFLRGSNLKKGRITLEDANYISKKKHSELTTGHLFLDDIVIAVRGSLGAVGYVNENMVGNNINSQLAIIRTSNSLLYGKYLLYYLMSNQGKKELLSRVTGTALKQLPIKQIKQIKVPVPKLHEQHKIANFLSELDNLIDNQTEKIELLKERKKGFLQKMFV
ncbi:restriction endonuclease subunit S [Staphylococcus arlettae]|uniref:restriction endonuclease subunit S n=1 Tax=Staphylococcus arlettae TaxID=29378 RepID=UPI002DB55987|nr:restriction endonuclease subunit S [Staphylococcus arlettae]MEB7421478.1 restriction endonuclease subunit S [Staphylococcus arlettae]